MRSAECEIIPGDVSALTRQGGPERDWEGDWATGGGVGVGGDCTGDECAAGFGGLRGAAEVVWDKDNIFCLMSCSVACSVATLCAICSCLTASCSRPRRIAATSRAIGSSCGNSEIVAAAGASP